MNKDRKIVNLLKNWFWFFEIVGLLHPLFYPASNIIFNTNFFVLFFLFFRNSVRLAIRKVMYAPSKPGEQPSVEVSKEFMMSPSKLHLEVSLDKELYYHGETLSVNVHIQNNSNKPVKKIKVSVRQFADICLFSTAQYKCSVSEIESE